MTDWLDNLTERCARAIFKKRFGHHWSKDNTPQIIKEMHEQAQAVLTEARVREMVEALAELLPIVEENDCAPVDEEDAVRCDELCLHTNCQTHGCIINKILDARALLKQLKDESDD